MRICLGGTFNILHKGHKRLISLALKLAGSDGFVFIGLSTGKLLKKKKNTRSFDDRKEKIVSFISHQPDLPSVVIEPIDNVFGPTLDMDFDDIVVSHETVPNARLINEERRKRGLSQLKIVEIPLVLADDGKPISASRIQAGKITKEGHIPLDSGK
jgi:pantetheine-phosphate adenylyltransferase